jgi:ribosomal protein L11 methyltransferase
MRNKKRVARSKKSRSVWSLSQQISPVMGEVMLELLKYARGGSASTTEIPSKKGILLEQVQSRLPTPRANWKRKRLAKIDLKKNNSLSKPLQIGRWLIFSDSAKSSSVRKGVIPIQIEARMGFGSGSHETTRLCLQMMEKIGKARSLLDVGTGSGILAIAGYKMGIPKIVAVENDPAALKSARHNGELNHCGNRIKWRKADIAVWKSKTQFHVITANLLSGLLLSQAKRLSSWLEEDGFLLISGLLKSELPEVEAKFRSIGFKLSRKLSRSRWGALAFQKCS